MDIHKPKPVHSWRELASEIGVVVIGILIALTLEQVVEAWRDHRHVVEARENARAEIARNLGYMVRRAETEPCVSKRLDEIAGLIAQVSAGQAIKGPIWIGHPLIWFTSDGRYKTALQSGGISLMPTDEQAGYSNLYTLFAEYTASEKDEKNAWNELRTLDLLPTPSPGYDQRLRSALEHARMARWQMEVIVTSALQIAKDLHLAPEKLESFKQESVCIPLHTPRDKALKLVIEGRPAHLVYDEP
ncbi:hypothetical protein ACLB0R_11320 [Sphingomonas sp. GlSt437]|uniref:hypothetical protein n=1 Tax=Sphingomonas sp. GlSt437 TaxID=3389970 RepID=UPI003A867B32